MNIELLEKKDLDDIYSILSGLKAEIQILSLLVIDRVVAHKIPPAQPRRRLPFSNLYT